MTIRQRTYLLYALPAPAMLIAAEIYLLIGWRASVRRARGQCGHCGYDLRSSDAAACPECGSLRS
ncbi:MAG: hypothetical protein U0572_15375 [Phycisphaerales bacterium]